MELSKVGNFEEGSNKPYSRLLDGNKGEESYEGRICHQLDKIMKSVSAAKPVTVKYDTKTHLMNLTKIEIDNLGLTNQRVSSAIKCPLELFETNSENAIKLLSQTLFPEVQPAVDKKLVNEAKILKNDIKCLKDFFSKLSLALEKDFTSLKQDNIAFKALESPIKSYHKIYNKYLEKFSWVKRNYKEMSESLDARINSDSEKNAPKSISNYIASSSLVPSFIGKYINNDEGIRKNNLETLEFLYGMEVGQSTKDLEDLHTGTDTISTIFSGLKTDFEEFTKIKKLCKRSYCHVFYCYQEEKRNSWYDNFEKEYDQEKPKGEKNRRYLKLSFESIENIINSKYSVRNSSVSLSSQENKGL